MTKSLYPEPWKRGRSREDLASIREKGGCLICSGFHNKILLAAEVQDQGAVRVSGEASLPGLLTANFRLDPHVAFVLCVHIPGVSSSSHKDMRPVELGPLRPHLTLTTS